MFWEYVHFLEYFWWKYWSNVQLPEMLFQETFSGPCLSKTIRGPCFGKFIIGGGVGGGGGVRVYPEPSEYANIMAY